MIDALGAATAEADMEGDGCIRGFASGTVTDNKDPDGLARVRVRLNWQPDSQQTFWARLVVPMATKEQGVYFVPSVGDEVLVGFERGEPSNPFVIGSVWNGKKKPPETNANGKNDVRVIRTRADSELRFFDGDQPWVKLSLKDGKHALLDDAGIRLDDGKGNTLTIETRSGAIKVTSKGEIALESTRISLKAQGSMELKASGTLTIQGAMVQIN